MVRKSPRVLAQRMYRLGLRGYRNYRWYSSPERVRMRRTIRNWLRRHRPTGVLLEIGAGTAMLRSTVEQELSDIHYVGGDIAPTDASTVVFDATRLPVRNSSVSALMALEVLEHIEDPRHVIQAMSDALAPNGLAVLTTPFMFGVHDYRDYFRFTPLGLRTLLNESDLELRETIVRGGAFVSAAGLVKSMLRHKILGAPTDWRARGVRKKVLWMIVMIVEVPWVPIMWLAMGLDRVLDRDSQSPPGYFFLCVKNAVDRRIPMSNAADGSPG